MNERTDARVRKWRLPVIGNSARATETNWCRVALNLGPEFKFECYEDGATQATVTAPRHSLLFLPRHHEPMIRLPRDGQRGPRAARHRLFSDLLLLKFDPALFDLAAARLGQSAEQVSAMPLMSLTLDEVGKSLVKPLALAMREQSAFGSSVAEQLAIALAMWIVEHRQDESHVMREKRFARSPLERVVERIESDSDQDLSLQALADEACMSRHHFARVFKANTGRSPHQFVLQARTERAKLMLARCGTGAQANIGTIALDAGFSSHSQFSKIFKQLTGMSPVAWQRAQSSTRFSIPLPRD